MEQLDRRQEILRVLETAQEPLSGGHLASMYQVTRQVIVRDIALLKAHGHAVLSTPQGYLLHKSISVGAERLITVCHTPEEIEDELAAIIDLGGCALTTRVAHPAYGYLEEDLQVGSGKELRDFLRRIEGSAPLLSLTGGLHQHRIRARTEADLDEICAALAEKGYLISD